MASPGLLSGVHLALALGLAAWTLLFLARLVLTWYPQIEPNQGKLRWLGALTEPLLAPTRALIQPIGGVDVRELLVGQQGLLTQVLRQSQLASLS
jgi:YggT family protein